VLVVDGVTVLDRDPRLDSPLAETERALRARSDAGPMVAAVRAMYRRFGVDPTRTRPSSEALLRRLRRGESLPRVNSLVDIGNWCSVETQLPFGLYDRSRVHGAIELRLGRQGEQYPGIRKELIHVQGRLTLADEEGPFGNPSADSARTAVTSQTVSVLIVIFAPTGALVEAQRAIDLSEERVLRFGGGRLVSRSIGFADRGTPER
jgi:DNA/RNA-binding domain of Phe-tRNA-synthetase-like protein